jgi:sterol desaturase/sphingolipid hydroxylase (fatty acid hydroxylase superfamily)
MNLKTIFKRLILLDLLLIILLFESEEVADFNKYFESEFSNSLLIIFGILMLIYLINLFLLYRFISIGKQMYLIVFILGIILILIAGVSAADPWLYVIDGLGWSVSGAILVLLYFSPIKKEFEK